MKIDAQIAPVQGERSQQVEPRDQTTWQLAWRRELERAQESQPKHTQPVTAAKHSDAPSHAADQATLPRCSGQVTEDQQGSSRELKPVEPVPGASAYALPSAVDGSRSDLRLPTSEAPVAASLAGAARIAYVSEPHESASTAAQAVPPAALDALVARIERLAWMPKAAHISLQGSQITVALRDAQLSEQEAKDLLARLRKEVRSLGFELNELLVNGHAVQSAEE